MPRFVRPAFLAVPFVVALSGMPARTPPEDVPFLLTRLALDLRVNYESRSIAGSATMHLRNVSKHAGAEVPLLLNRLMTVSRVVDAAGVDIPFDQQVTVFRDDSIRQVTSISVRPRRPIQPGDSVVMVVRYGGILVGYAETGSLYIQDHVSHDFTIIREDAYAFPKLGVPAWSVNRSTPREPFSFAARVTVPARGDLVVAMGGVEGERTQRDSLVAWNYRSTRPVPFLNITIAPYRLLDVPGARIFYFPVDSSGARMIERAIAGAVERYTAWFGPLARDPHLTVMEIPEGFGSQASLTAGILQTADAFRNRQELRQVYHELSHVWNVPDLERPSPRWNEGLASFLQWRMAAELDGWSQWDGQLAGTQQSLMRRCDPQARCESVPMVDYGGAGFTDRSYSAGMLMFYVLYQVLGAEAFDRAYRRFFQQFRDSGATSAQLVAAFHAENPKSDPVLSDWLLTTRWFARLTSGQSLEQIVNEYKRGGR